MQLNRRRAILLSVFLFLTLAFTRFDPESHGDTLQVTLPLAGLGCAVASGNAVPYFTRYVTLWLTIHTSKRGLGDAEINQRPSGRSKGFPSAHTASAVFGASSLVHACLDNAPMIKTAVVIAAAYTGSSRIAANAHDIWQVLAGALLALFCERGFRRRGGLRRVLRRLRYQL